MNQEPTKEKEEVVKEVVTHRAGDVIQMSDRAYMVQEDGSWKKVKSK